MVYDPQLGLALLRGGNLPAPAPMAPPPMPSGIPPQQPLPIPPALGSVGNVQVPQGTTTTYASGTSGDDASRIEPATTAAIITAIGSVLGGVLGGGGSEPIPNTQNPVTTGLGWDALNTASDWALNPVSQSINPFAPGLPFTMDPTSSLAYGSMTAEPTDNYFDAQSIINTLAGGYVPPGQTSQMAAPGWGGTFGLQDPTTGLKPKIDVTMTGPDAPNVLLHDGELEGATPFAHPVLEADSSQMVDHPTDVDEEGNPVQVSVPSIRTSMMINPINIRKVLESAMETNWFADNFGAVGSTQNNKHRNWWQRNIGRVLDQLSGDYGNPPYSYAELTEAVNTFWLGDSGALDRTTIKDTLLAVLNPDPSTWNNSVFEDNWAQQTTGGGDGE